MQFIIHTVFFCKVNEENVELQGKIMNFKQRNPYVLLDGPMGEYPLKLCFCLFNTKTFAILLSFFAYYAWKPMHAGCT